MKVITTSQGGIAISCRKNVYFKKGETLGIGDKGLSQENLLRLIEVNLAKDVRKAKTKDKIKIDELSKPDKPDEVDLTKLSKSELEEHAKHTYGVDLDKRQSLDNMIKELENFIKNSDDL